MTELPVLRERLDEGIAIVRLNRPDKRNALDSATLALLNDTLDELAADATLRVLVLSTHEPGRSVRRAPTSASGSTTTAASRGWPRSPACTRRSTRSRCR